jgi:hypothetical protein
VRASLSQRISTTALYWWRPALKLPSLSVQMPSHRPDNGVSQTRMQMGFGPTQRLFPPKAENYEVRHDYHHFAGAHSSAPVDRGADPDDAYAPPKTLVYFNRPVTGISDSVDSDPELVARIAIFLATTALATAGGNSPLGAIRFSCSGRAQEVTKTMLPIVSRRGTCSCTIK